MTASRYVISLSAAALCLAFSSAVFAQNYDQKPAASQSESKTGKIPSMHGKHMSKRTAKLDRKQAKAKKKAARKATGKSDKK
jgi:hypothetical protein